MPRFVIIPDSKLKKMSADAIHRRFHKEFDKLDRAMRTGGGYQPFGWDMPTAHVLYPDVVANLRKLSFGFDLCSR